MQFYTCNHRSQTGSNIIFHWGNKHLSLDWFPCGRTRARHLLLFWSSLKNQSKREPLQKTHPLLVSLIHCTLKWTKGKKENKRATQRGENMMEKVTPLLPSIRLESAALVLEFPYSYLGQESGPRRSKPARTKKVRVINSLLGRNLKQTLTVCRMTEIKISCSN